MLVNESDSDMDIEDESEDSVNRSIYSGPTGDLIAQLRTVTPKSYTGRAVAIASRILGEPNADVYSDYVQLGRQSYSRLNFCDLVKTLVTQRKPDSLPNLEPFLQYLHEVDFPIPFVTNDYLKQILRSKAVMRVRHNSTLDQYLEPSDPTQGAEAGPSTLGAAGYTPFRRNIRLTSDSEDETQPFVTPYGKRPRVDEDDDDEEDEDQDFKTPAGSRRGSVSFSSPIVSPISRSAAPVVTPSRANMRTRLFSTPKPGSGKKVSRGKQSTPKRPKLGLYQKITPSKQGKPKPLISPGPNRRPLMSRRLVESVQPSVSWVENVGEVEKDNWTGLRKSKRKRFQTKR